MRAPRSRLVITFAWISHILLSALDTWDVITGHRLLRPGVRDCDCRVGINWAREKLGADNCSETDKDHWLPPRVSGFLSPDIFKLSFSRELYAPVLQHAGPDQVTALARGRSYLMFCPIKSFDHGQPHFRKMCWKEFEQILTDHIPDSSNIGYIVSPLLKCSFRNFTVHCDAHLLFTTSASVA